MKLHMEHQKGRYLKELKESLGMDAVIADYRDLFDEFDHVGEDKARGIARRWIDESEGIWDFFQSPVGVLR